MMQLSAKAVGLICMATLSATEARKKFLAVFECGGPMNNHT